jgi:hypothetical protein
MSRGHGGDPKTLIQAEAPRIAARAVRLDDEVRPFSGGEPFEKWV